MPPILEPPLDRATVEARRRRKWNCGENSELRVIVGGQRAPIKAGGAVRCGAVRCGAVRLRSTQSRRRSRRDAGITSYQLDHVTTSIVGSPLNSSSPPTGRHSLHNASLFITRRSAFYSLITSANQSPLSHTAVVVYDRRRRIALTHKRILLKFWTTGRILDPMKNLGLECIDLNLLGLAGSWYNADIAR